MENIMRLKIAAILAAISIALAAFGTHGLKNILSSTQLNTFETATTYLFWHIIAIFIVIIFEKLNKTKPNHACTLFFTGISLFSGSLYLYLATQLKFLVYITPIGGLCFIAGWITFAINLKNKQYH
ncbi:DUF423 domain-containing protein [Candidatus Marinamargulisbacteria bacterium SCGC AG-414-C22]|nr:DUF423 domain-containing protein [Candidatus Marinamargulisbacteria bacterium SCGC AG-414-C22]